VAAAAAVVLVHSTAAVGRGGTPFDLLSGSIDTADHPLPASVGSCTLFLNDDDNND
jgi:hypothetical protein